MPASHPPEGLLLVDKPRGPTSHDVVDRVRRVTGQRRAGHTGTLDPMATGLLPVLLGPATRLARFLPSSPKTYEGRFRLGFATLTDDVTGRVVARHEGPLPGPDAVRDACASFRGRILQRPPAVSARKVEGRRMYALARRGHVVEASPRPVEVFRLDVEPVGDGGEWRFVAEVSAGTYVRALVRDLGARLGCGGVLAELRRTAIGPLDLASAASLGGPEEDPADVVLAAVVPIDQIPLAPQAVTLETRDASDRFARGSAVRFAPAGAADGEVRVLDPDGRLLGIGEVAGGAVAPRVVLSRR